MSSLASEAEAFFASRFADEASATHAASQRAYMKSDLHFHGVSLVVVRAAARDFARAHAATLDHDGVLAIARAAFASRSWDFRCAAIELLVRKRRALGEADAALLEELVRIARCWAHVDWIATKLVPATLREGSPELARTLRRWAGDDDLWVRRTALLAQHDALKAGRGDWALFVELAVPMLPDTSFWIRKAIGWVLREVSKKRPELVAEFLAAHGARCSGLTRREASKYLPG